MAAGKRDVDVDLRGVNDRHEAERQLGDRHRAEHGQADKQHHGGDGTIEG